MNKQAFLEQTYNSALQDELEKIASLSDTYALEVGAGAGGAVIGNVLAKHIEFQKKKPSVYRKMRKGNFISKDVARKFVNYSKSKLVTRNIPKVLVASAAGTLAGALFKKDKK